MVSVVSRHIRPNTDILTIFLDNQTKLQEFVEVFEPYRDDGLAVSCATPRQIDIMKKKVCKVFNNIGLSITIEANSKVVNFLDVTMDLQTGIYKPFIKENDTPLYVNKKSNHPPQVLSNIPQGINRRLSRISADKAVFDAAAPIYQEALVKSGYDHVLAYEPPAERTTKKRCRK